jgi:hypothetical protein
MNTHSFFHSSRRGIVADIGRNTVRVGITNDEGRLDHKSVREYDPCAQSTISTAISAFAEESGIRTLPSRAAIAVSGVPRGENHLDHQEPVDPVSGRPDRNVPSPAADHQ